MKNRFLFLLLSGLALTARADNLPEYQLKAAFLYNFLSFTEWPASVGGRLQLCVYGQDNFGRYLDELEGARIGERVLGVRRGLTLRGLNDCQAVFIAQSAIGDLAQVLDAIKARPILTLADSPGAARQGVAINMGADRNHVTFEANLAAAQDNGLGLSAKLLRLARKVYQ
jgi:hypothetical protein